MKSHAFFALLAAAHALVGTARAQEPAPPLAASSSEQPEVGLLQKPCAQPLYAAPALANALGVELAALGVHRVAMLSADTQLTPTTASLALVQVRCDDATQSVVIEISDLVTGQVARRELLLSDVQVSARPRALSLAVVMLMESAWADAAVHDSSTSSELPAAIRAVLRKRLRAALDEQVPPSAAPLAPQPAQHALDASTQLSAAALARAFPARSTGLLGTELGVDPCFSPGLCLPLRIEALLGSQELSDQRGRIASMRLYWLTAGVGLEWRTQSNPQLALGPFARIGYALGRADVQRKGYTGTNVSGVVSVLGLAASLRAPLSDTWSALVGIDLGYVPNGVVFLADLSRSAGMAEVTLAARIGLTLAL